MAKPVTNLIPRDRPTSDTCNALADLAEELYRVCMHTTRNNGLDAIAKAQRIVAELATVKLNGVGWPGRIELADAYEECRVIAAEGDQE